MSYERVNWENSPSTKTPINATNLNKMDAEIEKNAIAIEELQESVIINTDISVPASSFTTYSASGILETDIVSDYPYKADISIGGVTTDYKADVTPSYAASQLGILCNLNQTKSGYVRIYANAVPDEDISILSIACIKEA